ncbi:hypothetical protein GCM10027063_10360 [Promicromonospora xylanilytica]
MSFSKISLEGRLTVIAGPHPPSDDGFRSDRIQVLHWHVDEPYGDDGAHLHRTSDDKVVTVPRQQRGPESAGSRASGAPSRT